MDDRDKDLTHLFVRDLDELPLPPRSEWRRPHGGNTVMTRTSRSLLTAGAVVAVLAVALIVGLQLNERQQTAASPSASPTGLLTRAPVVIQPSPATGPTAPTFPFPGSAILNDDFGFIIIERSSVGVIRQESTDARLATFTGYDGFAVAVSPDGKQVAYFAPAVGSTPQTLRVFATGGNSTEQTLVTLAVGERGGGISWSSDGAALLYSTDRGGSIGGGPNSSTLDIYELAAAGRHGTTIDSQTNTGLYYRPIAWDRSANLAAAGLWGEGGSMVSYVTVRMNPNNEFSSQRTDSHTPGRLGILMQSVRASSDAKFALGVDLDSGDIAWWPLADFTAKKSQAGAGKRGALWRPGTHEIGFLSGDQLWLGDVDRAGALGLCCTAFSGAPATSSIRTFRADGSAVVLQTGGGSLEPSDYLLVRIGSDPKSTTGDRVTFQGLGVLIASVRLR